MPSTWLLLSRYTTTRGSTMPKQLCLPGISLLIEECTQCGASSGSSETLGESIKIIESYDSVIYGESMAMRLAHVLQILLVVSVPVSVPAFPCFPVVPSDGQQMCIANRVIQVHGKKCKLEIFTLFYVCPKYKPLFEVNSFMLPPITNHFVKPPSCSAKCKQQDSNRHCV